MRRRENVHQESPIGPVLRPFQRFAEVQASGGILLLVATVTALAWANSPWSTSYVATWQTTLSVGIGNVTLSKPLILWINEGLMTLFFFVVGLEIKREFMVGELAYWRHAALPILAALGGMVIPAAIYATFNAGTAGTDGWGIPMATDTAFALGILALLGSRTPVTLKIFLTALAIIDDIGALLVIALFYTADISWPSLAIGGVLLGVLTIVSRAGIRHPAVYTVLGLGLWLAMLDSGIHATIAGILLAMMIPAWSRIGTNQFLEQARAVLNQFGSAGERRETLLSNVQQQTAFLELMAISEKAETPLQRLEHWLRPWASFVVLPLFALANAGLALSADTLAGLVHPVSLGVVAGLVLGKPLGITAFVWLAVRGGLAALPAELTWRHIWGMGWLGGIGFTMSLFISHLAFDTNPFLQIAKVGILAGSIVSGFIGWALLRGIAACEPSD